MGIINKTYNLLSRKPLEIINYIRTSGQSYEILIISILVFINVILRLQNISSQIIDRHSHRQSITYSIIHNFYYQNNNILEPQMFIFTPEENRERLFMGEFPIYEYAVFLLEKMLGESVTTARIFSIILTLIITISIYLIGKLALNKIYGFLAALVFSFLPSSIFWGRSISPELFALACSTVSVYILLISKDTNKNLYISSTLVAFAIATKPYYLLILLLYFFIIKSNFHKDKYKVNIATSVVISCSLTAFWFLRRNLIPPEMRFPGNLLSHLFDGDNPFNYWASTNFFEYLLKERVLGEILTPLGGLLFLLGLYLAKDKNDKIKKIFYWSLATILMIVIVAWGNFNHDYYQLPILAPASLLIAYTLWQGLVFLNTNKKISFFVTLICFIVIFYYLGYLPYKFYVSRYFLPEMKYENFSTDITYVKNTVGKDQYVVVTDFKSNYSNPILLNHLERIGWLNEVNNVCDPVEVLERIKNYAKSGAKYSIFPKESYLINREDCDRRETIGILNQNFEAVYEGKYILLSRLQEHSSP